MSLLLTLPQWWSSFWPAAIEIALLYVVLYYVLRFLQGTRGAGVLRGLLFLLIMTAVLVMFFITKLRLDRIRYFIGSGLVAIVLPLVVLFQPEIRRILLRLGEASMLRLLFRNEASIVPEIVEAVFGMASRRIGGIITVEREVGLGTFVEAGVPLGGTVTSELLMTIFWPGSPLHDGGVIVRGDRIAAAGCFFPLTEQVGIVRTLGTRHRAAIGVTEESDALSIVVSEETQQVSVAHRGQLRMGLDKKQLRTILEESLMETVSGATSEGAR